MNEGGFATTRLWQTFRHRPKMRSVVYSVPCNQFGPQPELDIWFPVIWLAYAKPNHCLNHKRTNKGREKWRRCRVESRSPKILMIWWNPSELSISRLWELAENSIEKSFSFLFFTWITWHIETRELWALISKFVYDFFARCRPPDLLNSGEPRKVNATSYSVHIYPGRGEW